MRVALCDDHSLFLEAMATALRSHGVDVVAVCPEPSHAVLVAAATAPDVLLLDIGFPGEDGVAAIGRILSAAPGTAVVMFSACNDASLIATALTAGARGFLSKTLDLAVVIDGLERATNGEIVVLSSRPARPSAREQHKRDEGEAMLLQYLTDRERDVLRRLMRGDSTDEIGSALGTARSTTRTHIQNVLAKLGAHSRREAVAFAVRQGVQPLPPREAMTALVGAASARAPSD